MHHTVLFLVLIAGVCFLAFKLYHTFRKKDEVTRELRGLLQEISDRKKVEKEVLEISEKEQKRLGTHLHDELCQSLTGIMIMAKVLTQKMEKRQLPEGEELRKIGELLNQSITQAREMARGFYPVELQADSLMIALKDLAKRISVLYDVSCRFLCPQPVLIEDNNVSTHLYRIVQEAVHNSIKHGHAKTVEIWLQQEKDTLTLTVEDDGEGLEAQDLQGPGIGVHIMKYRARMIHATLDLRPNEPKGTVLVCRFTLPGGTLGS